MNNTYRRLIILSLLAFIFIAPGPIAYFFYQYPHYLPSGIFNKMNKGRLIVDNEPVVSFNNHIKETPWHLVLFNASVCDGACVGQLQRLQAILLALGRSYYQVDEWLVTPEAIELPKDLLVFVKKLPMAHQQMQHILDQRANIFIADSRGHFVLAYSKTASSDAIYHDLKQLLRSSGKISE